MFAGFGREGQLLRSPQQPQTEVAGAGWKKKS
jgi:hypothetical protein